MLPGEYNLRPCDYGFQSKIIFDSSEIERIRKRFDQFAERGMMDINMFKKSMGLLGIGECQFLCDRIFPLITEHTAFDSDEFLSFLNTITYGSNLRKAKISFDFLDKSRRGYIEEDDIRTVISEISFIWNFLTGQKISNSDSIALICSVLGIKQGRSISFEEYIGVYDNYIEWYDYFNSQIKLQSSKKTALNLDQLEEYLKLVYSEVESMIGDLKGMCQRIYVESQDTQEDTHMTSFSELSEIVSVKGPTSMSFQEFKPRGDCDNGRESLSYFRASALSKQIAVEGNTKVEVANKKLEQLSKIANRLFPQYHNNTSPELPLTARGKKKALMNVTAPEKHSRKIVYFGHQNWNIMLNMMLGIRKCLKSHFYKFQSNIIFTEEDLNCKYGHQLIYKQNNMSLKEISQIFVDYCPKVFFYIRSYFKIQNNQFLKSIGLQSLIGNLLMGNLTSLTDQTSQGKSGSFFYYTEDSKLIMKSISKDQYRKLRALLADYAEYVRKNPSTFLLHVYGLYKLKNKQTNRQIYFIVVNNFFETELKIQERYDIKGSTHNRQTKTHNPNTALKDVDLINSQRIFNIDSHTKNQIYEQIVKDSEFLSKSGSTQYSLLIGIGKYDEKSHSAIARGYKSVDHKQIYFFGIIDILMQYSAKKALENHFLHIFVSDISCLAPEEYSQRFKKFTYKYIFGQ